VYLLYKATICVTVGIPFEEICLVPELATFPLSAKITRGKAVSFFEFAHLCRKALKVVVIA